MIFCVLSDFAFEVCSLNFLFMFVWALNVYYMSYKIGKRLKSVFSKMFRAAFQNLKLWPTTTIRTTAIVCFFE